ncbi:hypothetical protein [Longispora albida]|uniref:hypothetical protein n=1 Tax=Longispora albida TaxID=203523 RepID=UPI00036F1C48|nr:hypothetical protein [Longispora albida]
MIMRLARRAIRFELLMWRSLYRWWIVRRPYGTEHGGEPFSYATALTPIMWAFIGVSAAEIPAVHLLLPWQGVRVAMLIIGVYGLTWMIGLLASLKTHPHIVDGEGMRLRYGGSVDITIPWTAVEKIGTRMRSVEKSRSVQLDGERLDLVISSQTNVDVTLREPVEVRLPKGPAVITELRFYADDNSALVARARELIGQRNRT